MALFFLGAIVLVGICLRGVVDSCLKGNHLRGSCRQAIYIQGIIVQGVVL